MKNIIQYITLVFTAAIIFSCSDEFVNNRTEISGVATSAIIISPAWESDNYQFQCENTGNSDFTIESQPQWLIVNSNSGKFRGGIATITCKANNFEKFAKTGVYIDQMMVVSGGKRYAIPLYYINEGEPHISVPDNFAISYNNYNNALTIGNTGDGILLWEVIAMPQWLALDTAQLNINNLMIAKNANASIPFAFNSNAALTGSVSGVIVLRSNDKHNPQVSINVTADLGTPRLSLYSSYITIDFGSTTTSKSISFSNQGNGILTWTLENLPDWLSVTKTNGTLKSSYDIEYINFTCDRSKLAAGLNSVIIRLASNDSSNPSVAINVTARAPGSNANIRVLEGNIIDATFDKSTNILYYLTSMPNKLIAYNVDTKTISYEIALSKIPTCFATSEDFTKAVVGHGGLISVVNLSNYSVLKTIEINQIVYDIEIVSENWLVYTEAEGSTWSTVYWANMDDNAKESGKESVYYRSILKKVPNTNLLLLSESELSSGLHVYNTSSRQEKNRMNLGMSKFWFIKNGEYVINGGNRRIYRTEAITSLNGYSSNGTSPIGLLNYAGQSDVYRTIWIDYSNATNSIWALFTLSSTGSSPLIYQFEDNDFTTIRTYYYDDYYSINDANYFVQAHYVFANGEGTELSVLRKGTNNNYWSIEFIPITE
ncbi:MAG: hypothetical protein LBV75_04065 [Paludibacter sp.]|jgi:hypothetical protein|nr:hypothetical protein [Paludibacter sp.]